LIVISHITKDSNLIQKLRTQRILGELIRKGQERGEVASQKTFRGNQYEDGARRELSTLSDIGITHKQSSIFQQIARIPEQKKARIIDQAKALSTGGGVTVNGFHQLSSLLFIYLFDFQYFIIKYGSPARNRTWI
jgi:hypothetical protein